MRKVYWAKTDCWGLHLHKEELETEGTSFLQVIREVRGWVEEGHRVVMAVRDDYESTLV